MAAYFNRVLLMGNLTRDPEVRYTPKGTAVTDIGIAINRVIGGEEGERREEVTYVDVTLWGRQAEIAQQYLTKGRGVFIEGRLQLDTWDDKQTGQKRSKLRVVGENMQMLPGRGAPVPAAEGEHAEPPTGGSAGANPPSARRSGPAPRPQPARDPDLDAEPDDIPF
ncbi:MAG: single-stranded DNA-binding protein [Verrucomicrobia bacterium]|nr:single-stranded DNA-binding protein [Verrucomicrobiota bacterium]